MLNRIRHWIAVATGVICVPSWLLIAGIEGPVGHHPSKPDGEYSVPLLVQGVVRYVTPKQKFYDHAARVAFAGSVAIGFLTVAISEWLKRRRNSK